MSHSIGVLLTSHKRPHTLRPQLAAIDAQTVRPADVIIWHNDGGVQPDVEAMRGRKVVAANFPAGVWSRFSAALWLFNTAFIVVLDDDTIPGHEWLAGCLESYERQPALIGINGVIFPSGFRLPRDYLGMHVNGGGDMRCDLLGHGWFIKRSILQFACDTDRPPGIDTAGEDYHLAFSAQCLDYPCIVPCRREESVLGSLHPQLGADSVALYVQDGEEQKKRTVHDFYRRKGWRTLSEMTNALRT